MTKFFYIDHTSNEEFPLRHDNKKLCAPMSGTSAPSIWMASAEGDGGVSLEDAWNALGKPQKFNLLGGNGSLECVV